MEAVLVLDVGIALALDRLRDDHDRLARDVDRLGVGAVDRLDVVAVDLDRVAAEGARAVGVGVEIPAVHRLAALAEPVHVEDRDEVVELEVRRVLERLPLRALGDLAVAAERPDAERQPVELLAGERHADRVRQALAERAGRDVDPRDPRRRVPLEDRVELPVRQQLLLRDRAGGAEHRVEERRRVALREDEPVVVRVVRVVEVVAQVLREQHGHQVGRGHARGRMAGARLRGGADRVDPQLLPQLAPELDVVHGHDLSLRRVTENLGGDSYVRSVRVKVAVAFDHRGVHLRERDPRDAARGAATRSSTSAPTPTRSGSTIPTRRPSSARRSRTDEAERGVLVCGSGVGASVAACKIAGIRAAICHDVYSAHQGVEHDDMNVLCLGSEVVGPSLAADLVRAFLAARFDGGERYVARLEKVRRMEEGMREWLNRDSTS